MKALPKESLSKNVSSRDHCRWCGDLGYVTVTIRTYKSHFTDSARKPNADGQMPHDGTAEEMAPCPYCEAGYREEFPVPAETNKHPTRTIWGNDGYWQGRDVFDLQPLYPQGFKTLPMPENARRRRELLERMGTLLKDMPD